MTLASKPNIVYSYSDYLTFGVDEASNVELGVGDDSIEDFMLSSKARHLQHEPLRHLCVMGNKIAHLYEFLAKCLAVVKCGGMRAVQRVSGKLDIRRQT